MTPRQYDLIYIEFLLRTDRAIMLIGIADTPYILTPDNKLVVFNPLHQEWVQSAIAGKTLEETLGRIDGTALEFVSSWDV